MLTALDILVNELTVTSNFQKKNKLLNAFATRFLQPKNSPLNVMVHRDKVIRINRGNIYWVEAHNHHVVFHFCNYESAAVECCYELHEWEKTLLPYGYLRVCRDAIINFSHINVFTPNPLTLSLPDHSVHIVSPAYRPIVLRLLNA